MKQANNNVPEPNPAPIIAAAVIAAAWLLPHLIHAIEWLLLPACYLD